MSPTIARSISRDLATIDWFRSATEAEQAGYNWLVRHRLMDTHSIKVTFPFDWRPMVEIWALTDNARVHLGYLARYQTPIVRA